MTESSGRLLPGAPWRSGLRLAGLSLLVACLGPTNPTTPPGGELGPADFRILWIGNSLTYQNDLPGVVAALAAADGRSMTYAVLAAPNTSLEDHWRAGAEQVIAESAADLVVLQQGPSSTPENQQHLAAWSETFAAAVREAGGVPALYMVWPPLSRFDAFDDVAESYANAAEVVDGYLVPAGEAWRRAWAEDPDLPLYASDGFHPSALGTALVALTVYETVAGDEAEPAPCYVDEIATVSPERGELLCAAAREAVSRFGRRPLSRP